jgi:protein phosphatase 1 regulatory subunit 37
VLPSPIERFVSPIVERDLTIDFINRSRAWVEEEAEIFRKGQVLLGPDEMEGDFDGEELRVEVGVSFGRQECNL